MCPNAKEDKEHCDTWLASYAIPVAERLNEAAPGALLTAADIPYLMSLCAFETVAASAISQSFCNLFEDSEFEGYEYYQDLAKYYSFG